MKCTNCGAPMRLYPQPGYYACDYCRASYFPTPSPDGVRRLGPAPEGWHCSICAEELHSITVDDRYQGHMCPGCEGLLLARPAFGETVHNRRLWAAGPPDPSNSLDKDALHRRLRCPSCGVPMDTHPYYGPGALVVDTCGSCNVIWLDRGELARAVNAPGADRGAARAEPPDRSNSERSDNGGRSKRRRQSRLDLGEATYFLVDLLDDIFFD